MIVTGGSQAWVTSAVNDSIVDKAVVLAGSLRRVKTTKKLVVITALSVAKKLREKLEEIFDLVVLLEQHTSNGFNLEDYAKVGSFSLQVFTKCVYLSPATLVLKNCDEIFEKDAPFLACVNGNEVDSSVFVFTPCVDYKRALEAIAHGVASLGKNGKDRTFSTCLKLWMKNNIANWQILETSYNCKINLENEIEQGLELETSIVHFTGSHPLEMSESKLATKFGSLGPFEKYAVKRCIQIFKESSLQTIQTLSEGNFANEPVAIVGMSFRLPGGNDVDEFWSLLAGGKDAIQLVPPFRWTREHTTLPCHSRNYQAGFLGMPIDEFDAKFFGISPKEAIYLDPQQRLLHEVTWEALEDAMIDPHNLQGTQTSIYVGSWLNDYQDIVVRCPDVDFFRVYMGNSIASEAARLSHFLGTTGPSIATESGCSSAIVAVHMACKSLRNRETNLALACGVNLILHPQDQNLLEMVVAPDGRCKTFDADANGFGRAEACAVLVLKRYSEAVKDGDNIWGLIRGSAVTQEGVSKSLGTPTVHCESLAMELALKDANLHPKDVSYVEAHGTGTSVGDPLEIAAITKAYSQGRDDKLVIGSVKTNVGHTESVSGITGIIKVLLSMRNETIPPHLNLKTINPAINLDAIPAEIPLTALPWPRQPHKTRIAGVSSFGISGTDGHAIIQEPPVLPRPQLDFQQERPLHIIKFSAKCRESLDEILSKYQTIFETKANEENNENYFADIAYSANFGRATFNERAVVIAKNFTEAAKIIREKTYARADVQSNRHKMCFLFTGQGSQYPNMAHSLYETSPVFKHNFDKCSNILEKLYGISIKDVLWGKSSDNLSRTLFSQTSIFCVEYCLLKLWESWGVKPDYVMGHSLGEFAAAVAAGFISFNDALMLVAERSRLIDSLPNGKMLVIKSDKNTVDDTISKFKEKLPRFWADYAALNSSDQTVVAGDSEMIEQFAKFCKEKQLKCIVLAATHAFHSRHMNPILEAYRKVASTVKRLKPDEHAPKYISGMEGKLIEADSIDADYWVRHTREKVSFIEASQALQAEGCGLFLEVGPHPVLSALVMMNIEGQSVTCFPSIRRKENEWNTLLESLSKLYLSEWNGSIDWKGFDKYYNRRSVSVPFYQFNRKPVWMRIRPRLGYLHPLVGQLVPNASGVSIFEHEITVKQADFTQDHVIGNTIIFPGAAFLEMCLVGGHSSVQGFGDMFTPPRRPVSLKEVQIKSPLALYQDSQTELCVLQTVVTMEDDGNEDEVGYTVNISRLEEFDASCEGQWITHASAKFLPVVSSLPDTIADVDIANIQDTWEKTENNNEFYEKLPEVGLRFGPKFQSLQTAWKSESGILAQLKVPTGTENYVMHPVIGDAMIQAAMLWSSKDKIKRKLQVPVQVGEFIWLKDSAEDQERYIFCGNDANGSIYTLLLDSKGTPLAYMSKVDFAETTAKLIEGMVQQQAATQAQLWDEIWKPVTGAMQKRLELLSDLIVTRELSASKLISKNDLSEEEQQFYSLNCNRVVWYFVNALYVLGWQPRAKDSFSVSSLIEQLSITPSQSNYVKFNLKLMANFGYVTMNVDGSVFSVTEALPTSTQVNGFLNDESIDATIKERVEYRLINELGNHLAEILSGKQEVLQYLFPTDSGKPHAQQFYDSLGLFVQPIIIDFNQTCITPYIRSCVESSEPSKKTEEKYTLRILEVGSGTGSFSKRFIEGFSKIDFVEVEYYYTDISAAFFGPAEKFLEEYLSKVNVVFKKFNMEEDPFQQGLVPEYFDVILACEVIHVSKKLRPVLQQLRTLLKPNGCLQIYETVKPCPRLTFIFGLIDGYWKFEDLDLRPDHITLSHDKWIQVLKSTGFAHVGVKAVYNGVHGFIVAQASENTVEQQICKNYIGQPEFAWIIFTDGSDFALALENRMVGINRKVVMISKPSEFTETCIKNLMKKAEERVSELGTQLEGVIYLWGMPSTPLTRDQSQISLPLVSISQHLVSMEKQPKLCIVTQGTYCVTDSPILHPSAGSLRGMVRTIGNEHGHSLKISHMDLSPSELPLNQLDQVFYNLWSAHEVVLSFRERKAMSPKLAACKLPNEYLMLPNGCDRYQLVLPESRMIPDLEFSYLDKYTLEEQEIEVQVKAMALNFRDVFVVLKPLPIFEKMNAVGLDFSGIVSKIGSGVTAVKVGDRVIGMNMNEDLSLPSHIKIDEKRVVHIPKNMTFLEGVTLPAVFSTAVYCLVNVAKMKKGETVLVHTATGGVGLCAIQIAQQVGANVIATAGNTRKRNFLRNLGIKHVFNSRTTDFGQQILDVTNGKGVDIVLNSITGPGFKEASLSALKTNGRFIEMSKLTVWTQEEVKELRSDVMYQIVDLTSLEKTQYEELSDTLKSYIKTGAIKPIVYERYDALNIRGALNYLQKAKHIGKVVCVMPEVKVEKTKLVTKTPLFNEDSTYLVTGGLGGIGFEVVKWLLSNEAKHVVIVSRSSPKPEVASQIDMWNKNGKHVQAFAVDVGDFDQCKQLFDYINCKESGFPPIRGVMHAAGVLQDGTIENQSWESFEKTYNPKVNGTWNLHDLTKDMILEHFVLFSSIAPMIGSPGQANHCASNSFEDTLAEYRRSIGLPALNINWGTWGEVGVATEVDVPGVRPISTKQGLLALETFLRVQKTSTMVMNVDTFGLLTKLMPMIKTYVDDKRLLGEVKSRITINSDELWAKVDAAESREDKIEVFKSFIKDTIKVTLKLDADEEVDDNAEFQALGIDSLMMLELKNALQNILGSRMTLSAAQLKDCNNTWMLANRLVDILEGEGETGITYPTGEELCQLIRDDSILPDTICVNDDLSPAKNIKEIDTVLLTGVTGTLGPYLLRELSQNPQIKKIYCLIRKRGKESTEERLRERLERVEILNDVDMEKVECLKGDIAEPRLGLSAEDYEALSVSIDAIIHSAVRSDHTAKYWKAPESRKLNVRSVNVKGTLRILELAVSQKLKHIYHASTLLTVQTVDEEGRISEAWQDVGVFDDIASWSTGYPLSKHIAEQLMKQAVERGVPVKTFRLPGIAGDSKTGRCDFEMNHVILRWLAYMKLGCMPDVVTPLPLLPVDLCARFSLEAFMSSCTQTDVYNVSNPKTGIEQNLVEVANKFGIHVDLVPFSEFIDTLKKENSDSPLALFKESYEMEGTLIVEKFGNSGHVVYQKFTENAENFFTSYKLTKLRLDFADSFESINVVLERDLTFLKNSGVFEKFGIKTV